MSNFKDSSAIKLFGQTIPLLTLNQDEALADLISGENSNDGVQAQTPMEDQVNVDWLHTTEQHYLCLSNFKTERTCQGRLGLPESMAKEFLKDKQEDSTHNEIGDDLRDSLAEIKSSKNEEVSETTSQDKTSKRSDKPLPCPRCNSKETKFCYFNNYNVNQPRHFCKNCQRYWTAGGTMRNVPVGAGRRKTKSSSALHYHPLMVSEAIRAAQASAANGIHRNPSCENSGVVTFGSDSSIPIASVFNLSKQVNVQNGIHKPEQRIRVEDNQALDKIYQWFPSCFTRPSSSFLWNSIQWNTASTLPPPPIVSLPGFPVSFRRVPTYRNYSVPNPSDAPSYSPTSATLGKHSRDGNIVSPANLEKENPSGESDNSEGRALNLKTMKIDDPGEAAKSSMSLVVKSKKNSINSGGLFDGFQSKSSDERNYRLETLSVLRANPAAFSRSLKFHENT